MMFYGSSYQPVPAVRGRITRPHSIGLEDHLEAVASVEDTCMGSGCDMCLTVHNFNFVPFILVAHVFLGLVQDIGYVLLKTLMAEGKDMRDCSHRNQRIQCAYNEQPYSMLLSEVQGEHVTVLFQMHSPAYGTPFLLMPICPAIQSPPIHEVTSASCTEWQIMVEVEDSGYPSPCLSSAHHGVPLICFPLHNVSRKQIQWRLM